MAETVPEWRQGVRAVAVLEEIVPGVRWYDEREKPVDTIRHHIEQKVVTTITEYILRECYHCSKTWKEKWRERNEV